MLPETIEVLREHGYLRGDETDTDKLAGRLNELLVAKPVESSDSTEIQEKAVIVAELRYTIFGEATDDEVEQDLDTLLTRLLGGNGKVQDSLENGYVLCAASVTRKLSHNGDGTITIKRRGRFVSGNADVIEQYYLAPKLKRVSSAASSLRHGLELATRRQPELEARQQKMIEKAHESVQLELPVEAAA